jgi:hypothetical protein
VSPFNSSATIETDCLFGDRTKREDRVGARLAVDRR